MSKTAKKKVTAKKVLFAFLLLMMVAFLVSLINRSAGEWVCLDGVWTSVGQPKDLPPDVDCRSLPTPTLIKPTQTSSGIPLDSPLFEGGEVATDSVVLPYGYREAQDETIPKD